MEINGLGWRIELELSQLPSKLGFSFFFFGQSCSLEHDTSRPKVSDSSLFIKVSRKETFWKETLAWYMHASWQRKPNLNDIANWSCYWQKATLILLLFTFVKNKWQSYRQCVPHTSYQLSRNEVTAFKIQYNHICDKTEHPLKNLTERRICVSWQQWICVHSCLVHWLCCWKEYSLAVKVKIMFDYLATYCI